MSDALSPAATEDENEEREKDIRERLAQRTQGEWIPDATCGDDNVIRYEVDDTDELDYENPGRVVASVPLVLDNETQRDADTQFIAHAPADLLWALERIEALKKDAARLDALLAMPLVTLTVPDHDGSVGKDVCVRTRDEVDAVLVHASQYEGMPEWPASVLPQEGGTV